MRKLRLTIILLAAVIAAIIIFFVARGVGRTIKGQASSDLKDYYNEIKADDLNNKDITLNIDDKLIILSSDGLWFREDLEPYVCAENITELFGSAVDINGTQGVIVSSKGISFTALADAGEYIINSDGYDEDDTLIIINEKCFVKLDTLAKSLGYRMSLRLKEMSIELANNRAVLSDKLPTRYSMLDAGRLPSIDSQGSFGTCWAYAAMAALESYFYPAEKVNFSEEELIKNNGFNVTLNQGGDSIMALAYFSAWKGPVAGGVVAKHVQESINIPAKDYEMIKRMIYEYGGVESSFYSDIDNVNRDSAYYNKDTGGYYYDGNEKENHNIVIVGWDDHFSKDNFKKMPEKDGAFLCRNSWGNDFGSNGYFYISYEDVNIGHNNWVYTRVDSSDNYDIIYQSDLLGHVGGLGYNKDMVFFGNIYSAGEDEVLKAAAFYTLGKNSEYEIYVVKDYSGARDLEDAELVKTGTIAAAGYHTIDFGFDIHLEKGKDFGIVVKLKTEGVKLPAAVEYNGNDITRTADITDGRGYISSDGINFESAEESYGCNICLKAFTDRQGK